jgi:type I restriction enzyme, S subunit
MGRILKSTASLMDQLKPNSDWAKLPLFNRKNWSRVRFGDVVENFNETCEPAEAGLQRFIGLEHLEPGSLHVRTWGNVAEGTTFNRRCRRGQVLFGKRRAYQRKVAVAEFEAVVSGDIYVLAPKDQRLLPELLPFICLSERFCQHAVGTSAGSLSPRTNWSSLASFEFDLPPLDQQRRIADILWKADEVTSNSLKTSQALLCFEASFLHSWHLDRANLQQRPNGWRVVSLESLCSNIVDCLHATPECLDEGYPVIRTADVVTGRILVSGARRVSEKTYRERVARLVPTAGDIFYSREGERYGIAAPVPQGIPMCLGQRMMHFRANQETDHGFLLALLNSPLVFRQAVAGVIGTTSPHVNIGDIKAFKVPCPPLHEQRQIGAEAAEITAAKFSLENHLIELRKVQIQLVNACLP